MNLHMQEGNRRGQTCANTRRLLKPQTILGTIKMLDLDKQVRILIQNPEAPGGNICMMPRDGIYGNPHVMIILDSDENKQKAVDFRYKHILNTSENLFDVFMHLNKPYRLLLLQVITGSRSYSFNGEYEKILKFAWMQTEFPHQGRIENLIDLFEQADPGLLMTGEELKTLANFPDELVIYRGLQDERTKQRGLSWTLDYAKALWFAHRWTDDGKVLKATIKKKHVFMYSDERGEKEVVVNPRHLKTVTVVGS